MKLSKRAKIGLFLYYIGIFAFVYWYWYLAPEAVIIDLKTQTLMGFDRVGEVNCDSNSMGLTLRCHDRTYSYKVSPTDALIPGAIYIYDETGSNDYIVHRLVYCIDIDCNQSIFKGDNNERGELVNRSQIKYQVMMARYW